ncbi:sodium hydrogen exchanger 3 protein [Cyclospora cayetanensis]|uniref:Sodium hydrogen exchanger 3 protein n=1 Tax=Cyclospora cayetanensis TaxID=88456 RepID=A0A1D3D4Q6_9EIME|nr:sodium hydrogen exchanger 3 protein [Cyclospora cayetanensis]
MQPPYPAGMAAAATAVAAGDRYPPRKRLRRLHRSSSSSSTSSSSSEGEEATRKQQQAARQQQQETRRVQPAAAKASPKVARLMALGHRSCAVSSAPAAAAGGGEGPPVRAAAAVSDSAAPGDERTGAAEATAAPKGGKRMEETPDLPDATGGKDGAALEGDARMEVASTDTRGSSAAARGSGRGRRGARRGRGARAAVTPVRVSPRLAGAVPILGVGIRAGSFSASDRQNREEEEVAGQASKSGAPAGKTEGRTAARDRSPLVGDLADSSAFGGRGDSTATADAVPPVALAGPPSPVRGEKAAAEDEHASQERGSGPGEMLHAQGPLPPRRGMRGRPRSRGLGRGPPRGGGPPTLRSPGTVRRSHRLVSGGSEAEGAKELSSSTASANLGTLPLEDPQGSLSSTFSSMRPRAAAAAAVLLLPSVGGAALPSASFWATKEPPSTGDIGSSGEGDGPSEPSTTPRGPLDLKSVLRFAVPFVATREEAQGLPKDTYNTASAWPSTATASTPEAPPPPSTTTTTAAATPKEDAASPSTATSSSGSSSTQLPTRPPEHSAFSTLNLLVLSSCLLLCFFLGYLGHTQKIKHLPDSAGAMLVGAVFGLLIRLHAHFTDSGEGEDGGVFSGAVPFAQHLPISPLGTPRNLNNGGPPGALAGLYFDPQFFYLVLLPPIVLDAGLSVAQYDFLRNGGPILMFAVCGTLVSALFIYGGLSVINEYLANMGLQGPPHKVRAFFWAFAALISATDTVAVMSLLNSPRFFTRTKENRLVHPRSIARYGGQHVVREGGELVYASSSTAVSFASPTGPPPGKGALGGGGMQGASLSAAEQKAASERPHERTCEDLDEESSGVSIALTRSVFKFFFSDDKDVILNAGVADIVIDFLLVLSGSLLFGVGVGALCCWSFKQSKLKELPQYEVAVTLLSAYVAFGTAEVLELSGVVSLFACAAMLCHFNTAILSVSSRSHNLSLQSRLSIRLFVQTIALLCDKCAFAYLGVVASLGFGHGSWNFFFAACGLLLIGMSRAAFVFPFSFFTNKNRRKAERMNMGQQIILWLAGLRGAVAFALAMSIPCDGDLWRKHCRDNKDLVVTTTLVLVVLTTVCVGSSLEYAVMSLSRVYSAGGLGTRRSLTLRSSSTRPSALSSPLGDPEQETLAACFLSPSRGRSSTASESPTTAAPQRQLENEPKWAEVLLRVDSLEDGKTKKASLLRLTTIGPALSPEKFSARGLLFIYAAEMGTAPTWVRQALASLCFDCAASAAAIGENSASDDPQQETVSFLRWYASIEQAYLRHWFGGAAEELPSGAPGRTPAISGSDCLDSSALSRDRSGALVEY